MKDKSMYLNFTNEIEIEYVDLYLYRISIDTFARFLCERTLEMFDFQDRVKQNMMKQHTWFHLHWTTIVLYKKNNDRSHPCKGILNDTCHLDDPWVRISGNFTCFDR